MTILRNVVAATKVARSTKRPSCDHVAWVSSYVLPHTSKYMCIAEVQPLLQRFSLCGVVLFNTDEEAGMPTESDMLVSARRAIMLMSQQSERKHNHTCRVTPTG